MEVPAKAPVATAFKSRIRPLLIVGIMGLIITEIVALSPSSVEEPNQSAPITEEAAALDQGASLASGIPTRIPDYGVDQFNYVSTQTGQRQWKMMAARAAMFNHEKLVHARTITAHLYNPDGKITIVTGKEAKYFMDQKDLEVFGDVHTQFPDGFHTQSEYLRYHPNTRKIEIPISYTVNGEGQEDKGQELAFKSQGLDFAMGDSEIVLPRAVRVTMTRAREKDATTQGVPDQTVIESDHCVIYRARQLAQFTMNPKRPLDTRFVQILQPTLFVRARRADLNYGDFSQVLQYMTAYEDVLIKEKGQGSSLRYATGGRADFDTRRDVIVLKEYPQVYQDNDTVTGEVVILHRDTDIVEVEHSNAFSEGQQQQQPQPQPQQSPQPHAQSGGHPQSL